MAEHHTGPAETGAAMDYKEHEKTYKLSISGAKVGSAISAALLSAMAAGFFGPAGFLGGVLVFIVLTIASIVLLR